MRTPCRPAARRPVRPGTPRKSAAMLPRLALLGAIAALAGCAPTPPEKAAALSACRAQADRVYNAQNRYQLSERDSTGSPFSGTGSTQSQTNQLADQYSHRQAVDDCVRQETGR